MSICKGKPATLDNIGLDPADRPDKASLATTRGAKGRHRTSSGAIPPSRQATVGLGSSPNTPGKETSSFNPIGNSATCVTASKLSSADGFVTSAPVASVSTPFDRSMAVTHTAGQGRRERTRTKRSEKRGDNNKPPGGGHQQGSAFNSAKNQQNANLEPVLPLQAMTNRWDRKVIVVNEDLPEIVGRKVRGLLNKLTMEKFDSISDQIITWTNKSKKENNGWTLHRVIQLLFENAIRKAAWSEMYAHLCRKMMEQISPEVRDDGIKNNEGEPIGGSQLFRKYLLNRCQDDFERGRAAKEATATLKSMDGEVSKAVNDKMKADRKDGGSVQYSEEYYAAQKARGQGLCLIKFIGELFKMQMLTERIMHECVKKLLGNVDNPKEEEIESLCTHLATVGSLLDTPKARAHLDVYFSRMRELAKDPGLTPRMQFMLQVRIYYCYVYSSVLTFFAGSDRTPREEMGGSNSSCYTFSDRPDSWSGKSICNIATSNLLNLSIRLPKVEPLRGRSHLNAK